MNCWPGRGTGNWLFGFAVQGPQAHVSLKYLQFYSGLLFLEGYISMHFLWAWGAGGAHSHVLLIEFMSKSVVVAMSGDVALNCALHGQFTVPE